MRAASTLKPALRHAVVFTFITQNHENRAVKVQEWLSHTKVRRPTNVCSALATHGNKCPQAMKYRTAAPSPPPPLFRVKTGYDGRDKSSGGKRQFLYRVHMSRHARGKCGGNARYIPTGMSINTSCSSPPSVTVRAFFQKRTKGDIPRYAAEGNEEDGETQHDIKRCVQRVCNHSGWHVQNGGVRQRLPGGAA